MRQALASVGDWEALRKFANERRSPIGYKPFALACMRHSKPGGLLGDDRDRHIESYIERVRDNKHSTAQHNNAERVQLC